jgi:hypothetical protein
MHRLRISSRSSNRCDMRIAVVIGAAAAVAALGACGTPDRAVPPDEPATQRPVASLASAPIDAAVPDAAPAAVAAQEVLPAIHSPHAQQIAVLAVADDGAAVVTADELGSVRLWPSLDGKHEPAIVRIAPPRALAVTAIDDELVVGGIDSAGMLEVARLSPDGSQRGRVQVDLRTAAIDVVGTPHGLLVERADNTFALVDRTGAVVRTLAPPPGHHVQALAFRRGQALVLLATGSEVRGRTIELPALTWGEQTAPLAIAPGRIVLSPDHHKLATIQHDVIVTFDLATGRRKRLVPDESQEDHATSPLRAIGYVSDDLLAVRWHGYIAWWRHDHALHGEEHVGAAVAATDGRVIEGDVTQLALVTPSAKHYLGYRIDIPSTTALAGRQLLVGSRTHVAVADLLGRTRRLYSLGDPQHVSDSVPVDATHALVSRFLEYGGGVEVALVSLPPHDAGQVIGRCSGPAHYEQATQLLACNDRLGDMWVARYDGRAGTFSSPVQPGPGPQSSILLVDPARADGAVAIRIQGSGDTYVSRILAIHTDGREQPFDEEEHHYVDMTAAVAEEQRLIKAGMSAAIVRRHGAMIARLENSRLSLRVGKAVQWEVAAETVTDSAWTSTGELVVIGSGVAHVDLATGAFVDRQCGFGFGLWPDPSDNVAGPLLCEE